MDVIIVAELVIKTAGYKVRARVVGKKPAVAFQLVDEKRLKRVSGRLRERSRQSQGTCLCRQKCWRRAAGIRDTWHHGVAGEGRKAGDDRLLIIELEGLPNIVYDNVFRLKDVGIKQ